jgi:hypothetical protein
MTYYAHASAGCLHIRPLLNLKQGADIDKMRAISLFVADLLGAYGGALSSEHGDGRVRSWLAERSTARTLYGLFREVKAAFDPHNLFNPGNIVDAPAQDASCARAGLPDDSAADRAALADRLCRPKWRCATAPASVAS